MYKGGSKVTEAGFTIVETLIVLAVTGMLFVSAALLISGRQSKTQFTTSINSLQQQLQQIINETASGFYPNNGQFTCIGTTHPVTFSTTATQQGANSGCLFLGKAVQFGTDSDQSGLGILPLVGNQYSAGSIPVTTIVQAKPRALYPAAGETGYVPTDAYATDQMEYGLKFVSGSYQTPSGGTAPTAILAFITGDSTGKIAELGEVGLQPGTQQFTLYAVNGSVANQSPANATRTIGNAGGAPSGLVIAKKVSICVASGTNSQSGLFTIDDGLHVHLQVYGGATCS